jgi:8-oxo-dGTP pyrophosphatase MutT (NUDIX family)
MGKWRLSSSAVVLNRAGQVLLVKQGQRGRGWELPGGHVRKSEGSVAALRREVKEETGVDIKPQKLMGVFHIPKDRFTDLVFLCAGRSTHKRPRPRPPEIVACAFFPPTDLPKPMRSFVKKRIADALTGRVQALPVVLRPKQWLA